MTTYEKIPEIIKLNGFLNWKIRKSKNDANSFLFVSDEDKSVDANIEDMNKLFTWEFGDFYILDASRFASKSVGTGRFYYEFSNKRTADAPARETQCTQQPTYIGAANAGISEEELDRRIKLTALEIENKYKAEKLNEEKRYFEEERRAFQAERDSGLNLILTKIGSVVLPMLQGTPQVATQGITGTPEEESNIVISASDSDGSKADELIKEWLAVDSEAIELLTKIVSIAKSNPTMYNMAKTMLKNQ